MLFLSLRLISSVELTRQKWIYSQDYYEALIKGETFSTLAIQFSQIFVNLTTYFGSGWRVANVEGMSRLLLQLHGYPAYSCRLKVFLFLLDHQISFHWFICVGGLFYSGVCHWIQLEIWMFCAAQLCCYGGNYVHLLLSDYPRSLFDLPLRHVARTSCRRDVCAGLWFQKWQVEGFRTGTNWVGPCRY